MEIKQFAPDDLDSVRRFVGVVNAVSAADSPWEHGTTVRQTQLRLRHGWDGEPPVPFLAVVDGETVGVAEYSTSEWDNQHLAWVGIQVHPDHRRRRFGSALLEAMLRRAGDEGRTTVGSDAWESDTSFAFAAHHGFEKASQAINRRQALAKIDWAEVELQHKDAASYAAAYELFRRTGRTPEAELAALAELTASINDAPTDDLDLEDEKFPPDRIAQYETAQAAQGRMYRVLAQHRETGRLAGHTVVVVDGERAELGEQHDTAVARSHRGHRLGLLLKSDLMLWLREAEPRLSTIDTWNAESNDHMIDVNVELGYEAMGRALQFQRSL